MYEPSETLMLFMYLAKVSVMQAQRSIRMLALASLTKLALLLLHLIYAHLQLTQNLQLQIQHNSVLALQ